MQTSSAELPTWDLTTFFPSVDSPEFQAAFARAAESIDELVTLFDRHGIGADGPQPDPSAAAESFEAAIAALNAITDQIELLASYLYATITIDTREESPQIRMSELEQRLVTLAQLWPRFAAWIGRIDVEGLLSASEAARDHEYLIRRSAIEAQHLMSPAEEELAAELRTSSGNAWSRLYDNVSSQITATLEFDGEERVLSMPELRLLAMDGRRDVRERAYRAELAAWEAHEVPIAAALNGIKGEALTLLRRRRWPSPLDYALFQNAIDRDVLDAMMIAARAFFPDARRYFQAKARLLGLDRLAWYDLFALVVENEQTTWTFERSRELILSTFAGFSPRLADMASRAFTDHWIDAPPRQGKSDGAYCIALQPGISRVFMNFTPAYASTSTLAHELGHAFHNVALAHRPGTQRESPSTLAETASIFCETLIRHAAVRDATPLEELDILEGSLQDATQVVVDITSRFLFEQRFFERRTESDVPISEIRKLMTEAQRETYGDGLSDDALHPYMWAVKGHYYSVDNGFYNFPYMFGLLFGLGLYHRSQEDPAGFADRYEELLSATGRAPAVDLAARFGLDLRSEAFWRGSLDVVRADIDRFIELASQVGHG